MEGSFAEGMNPNDVSPDTHVATARQRPQRRAAAKALTSISAIQAWENLPSNSAVLRHLAQSIDSELKHELQSGQIRDDDLDDLDKDDVVSEAGSDDEYFSACESSCSADDDSSYESDFVTDDEEGWDNESEWLPMKKHKNTEHAPAAESEDTFDAAQNDTEAEPDSQDTK